MAKYVIKQVPVECIQLTEDNVIKIFEWVSNTDTSTNMIDKEAIKKDILSNGIIIKLHNELEVTAHKGDWIIQNIKGEFAVCPNDIFNNSFELYCSD